MTRRKAMLADETSVGWESLGYVLFLLVVLLPASLVLRKAGVPVEILSAAMWFILIGAAIVPAAFVWSAGYDAFARIGGPLPVLLLALLPVAAMLPASIAIAFLSPGMATGGWMAIVVFAGAAILSLLGRIAAGRVSASDSLSGFLQERYNSPTVAQGASLLLALLLLVILCSQAAAFGRLSEQYFGLGHGKGIALCLAFSVMQIWISGVRGIVLGSACLGLVMTILAIMAWWWPDLPAPVPAIHSSNLSDIAQLALPFIPFAQLSSAPMALALICGIAALAMAFLPAFGLVATNDRRPSMLRPILIIAASLLLLFAFSAILYRVILPGSQLQVIASGYGTHARSGPNMIGHFALLAILTGLMVCAALPLHNLAIMASSLIRGDGRGYLPARRLALARIAILGIALGAGWLTFRFEAQIPAIAQFSVALVAAGIVPLFLCALLRPLTAIAGIAVIATGALVAAATFMIETEGAGLLPAEPMVSAALLGMLAAFLGLIASWLAPRFLPSKGN